MTDLEKYVKIEYTSQPMFSYDGSSAYFINNSSGNYQIYEWNMDTRKVTRLTKEENASLSVTPLSDGSLVFLRDDGGDEKFQMYLLQDNTEKILISDPEAKFSIEEESEKYLYFSSNQRDKRVYDFYRWEIPLDEHQPEMLFQPEEGFHNLSCISKDDKVLIISKMIKYRSETELFLLNASDGTNKSITGHFDKKANWSATMFLSEDRLLVSTDYNHDRLRPAVLDLRTLELITYDTLESIPFSLEYLTSGRNENFAYALYNENGMNNLYKLSMDEDEAKLGRVEIVDNSVYGIPTQDHQGKYLGINVSRFDRITTGYICELRTGTLTPLKEVTIEGIEKDFVDASSHTFQSSDGETIQYYKQVPQEKSAEQGFPAIFVIHGGPEAQTRPGFSGWNQYLIHQGYAIIKPNIRGSTGFGKRFMGLDDKEKRLDSIRDIKELADHLKNDPDIDTQQLIIYGGSYGGFAVLSAMVEYPEYWRAGIDVVGISNFVTFLKNTASWRRKLRETEYGSLDDDLEMLKRISPIHKIDNIQAPLFIIQGDNDERVPLSESTQIYDKLREKGLEVKLLRYADEGHGLRKIKNRIDAYGKVVDWLETKIMN